MALMDVTPLTAAGEAGMIHIMDEAAVDAWARANLAGLVEDGYARLVVAPHIAHNQRMVSLIGGGR